MLETRPPATGEPSPSVQPNPFSQDRTMRQTLLLCAAALFCARPAGAQAQGITPPDFGSGLKSNKFAPGQPLPPGLLEPQAVTPLAPNKQAPPEKLLNFDPNLLELKWLD